MEMARHITATLIVVFQDALRLNTEVIYFRVHSCNTGLMNILKHVAQSGYAKITTSHSVTESANILCGNATSS